MKKAGGDTGNGVPARLPSDERREEGSQLLLSPILLLREIPADDTLRRQGGKQCVESRGEDGQREEAGCGPHRDEQEQDQEQGLGQVAQVT